MPGLLGAIPDAVANNAGLVALGVADPDGLRGDEQREYVAQLGIEFAAIAREHFGDADGVAIDASDDGDALKQAIQRCSCSGVDEAKHHFGVRFDLEFLSDRAG